MRRPDFLSAAGIGLLLALAAGLGFAALTPVLAPTAALRVLISALGLLYLLWLLRGSERRAGRLTAVAAWLLLSAVSWLAAPSVLTALILHVALLWLLRSLVRYRSTLPALLDLGVSVGAVAAAAGAAGHTGSLFLSAWSFFLVQAFAVVIPARLPRSHRDGRGGERGHDHDHGDECSRVDDDGFEQARRRADAAFRQLITHY